MSASRVLRFEDLRVYQKSRELTIQVYELTRSLTQDPSSRHQIRRAVISISSNIAEGFERGSNADFVRFLYISKGSCGEVRAQLQAATDLGMLEPQRCLEVQQDCRKLSAMLANLITYLKYHPKSSN